jgi:hypothetical protein
MTEKLISEKALPRQMITFQNGFTTNHSNPAIGSPRRNCFNCDRTTIACEDGMTRGDPLSLPFEHYYRRIGQPGWPLGSKFLLKAENIQTYPREVRLSRCLNLNMKGVYHAND